MSKKTMKDILEIQENKDLKRPLKEMKKQLTKNLNFLEKMLVHILIW